MPSGRFWTTHEIKFVIELSEWRVPQSVIGAMLDRSHGSISTLLRDLGKPKSAVSSRLRGDGPEPIEAPSVEGDEEWGCERLKVAILTSLMRYANDNAIDIDTAAYRLLSKPNFSVDRPPVLSFMHQSASA